MISRRALAVAGTWALVVGSLVSPAAAAPWNNLFTRVEADPHKDYKLTANQGPWMIMAASFSGDGADQQARDLVLELRRKHKINAYVYDKVFDFSEPVAVSGLTPSGEQRMGRYQRNHRASDGRQREIAVVCGDYLEVDDTNAQRMLRQLKYAKFDCLGQAGKPDARNLAALRDMQKKVNQAAGGRHADKALKGPLGNAFITTNPMLPDEYFVPKGLDPLVIEMNKDVKHSLLKCQGKYTVKVATFNGSVVIDPKRIKQIQSAGPVAKSDKLAEGTQKAHDITVALRELGYEAYEFHDLHCSMVTIGSFDSLGNTRSDGKLDVDARIQKIIATFGPRVDGKPGEPATFVGGQKQLPAVKGAKFDMAPIVVQVPQQSIARAYDRTAQRVPQ